jgi:hypothetical protein
MIKASPLAVAARLSSLHESRLASRHAHNFRLTEQPPEVELDIGSDETGQVTRTVDP